MFTDGLTDNMFDDDIIESVDFFRKNQNLTYDITNAFDTAKYIADWARELSLSRKWKSPYTKAIRESGNNWIGGKEDNITVICA